LNFSAAKTAGQRRAASFPVIGYPPELFSVPPDEQPKQPGDNKEKDDENEVG
jgi:hypothetical protein